jgi:hypothetical protein
VGLFSFVGKALKGISKVAGFIPGIGGTISKVTGAVGNLLDHKKPLSTTGNKLNMAVLKQGVSIMRGNSVQSTPSTYGPSTSAAVLRMSPVLPGGAVATPSGPAPKTSSPAKSYRGSSSTKRRKAKKKVAKRGATRRTTRRKLKFGSKAYRKKYLGR